ncbi:host specificity factor TipJ family phage tail protein [Citrobacter sedlakii]|uniref:host specificity factor TipJ family phage tail protein n=1 Tax=Citrobacter sedlakii TaxID=67826 RepID=UPI001BAC40B4|nr:host specificity factor TipJ family phage tail protein [Citrobacter sedlakii]EKJ8216916.1 MoaD/ThiS family protein [Citrobacter sedlakii]QUC28973.1 MoaD/ThiS family protein [Citrobacter sedlakii]
MPVIEIQRVPGLPKDRAIVTAGTVFSEWLEQESFHRDIRIRVNGNELGPDDELAFPLQENDRVIIFDQPKSGDLIGTILNPLEHFNPIKFTQKVLAGLMPKPNASAAAGNSKTSSNNSLKGQANIARNGEAKPDNFGQIRSFPDLVQESMFEYVVGGQDNSGIKYVTEMMNFGLGVYDISSVRFSETNLGSMAGASYIIYQPGEVIPSVTEGYQFDDVDGQELPGPNENEGIPVETASANTVISGVYAGGEIAIKIVKQADFDYFTGLILPHPVTFTINVTYPVPDGTRTEDVTITANLSAFEETNDGAIVNPTYYYTFTFNRLSGTSVPVESATINTTKFVLNDNGYLIVGPFISPIPSSQLWAHVQGGFVGSQVATFEVSLWQVDEDNQQIPGTEQTLTYQLSAGSKGVSRTYYRTFKITPVAGYGRYAVSIRRVDNSTNDSKLQLEEIHAVNIRNNVVHPDDTLVMIRVRATENATGSRDRKYNALITRHVISYNMTTRQVDYTIRPSRRFADIALHNWLIVGEQPESSIDIYGLYQIQAEIDAIDPRLGYFDYTFDDEDVSLGSRMETICDAASVVVYDDNGVLSFTRDSKKTSAATIFNRSNTKPDRYSLSYDMTLPGGYDGVEVQFRNPDTNKQDFVRYRIVGNSIVEGMPTKAKKFEMMSIRNRFQANERALRECKRLIYSRMTMAITAMADGEWVNIGDMVQVPDTYDTNQQAGYIVSRNGNNFETSERINFSGAMYVQVTDSMGATTARYPASARTDTAFGFTAEIPDISLNFYDGFDVQSPSRYVIATSEELDAGQWTITAKQPDGQGGTAITLAEYSDLIYP